MVRDMRTRTWLRQRRLAAIDPRDAAVYADRLAAEAEATRARAELDAARSVALEALAAALRRRAREGGRR